jgi:hypothetical protein
LDLAATFVNAAYSESGEGAVRNRKNARKAYGSVLQLLANTKFEQGEEIEITKKLASLKSHLLTLGETF